jgi:hypothetical protein
MKLSMPLAAALASAAALTLPALADATTYCVAKPDCTAAGGTDEPSIALALDAAATASPGQDRLEIGPGDFTGPHGFVYNAKAGEGIDIVGSGIGATRLLNSSAISAETTLKLNVPGSSVSDLSIVAPTPTGNVPIVWGLGTSATIRRVDISGAHDFIGVQLNTGARLEDSSVHGDATHSAVTATGDSTVSGSLVTSDGASISVTSGATVNLSRTKVDAHAGPVVSGTATLNISDSLVTTHGGPGFLTSFGLSTTLHASGVTIVGDGSGSAGLLAGEGGSAHNTHVTVSNTVIDGYGHSIIANQAGGGVDVKLSHSDFDGATVLATAGQVDTTDANLNVAPGFADPAARDFRLAAGSPLVDAGDPAALQSPSQLDLGGVGRSLDGNGDGTAAPDIGAYETAVPPPPPVEEPQPGTGTPPGGDPGGDPGTGRPATQDAPPALGALKIGRRRLASGRRTSFRFTLSEKGRVKIAIRRVGRVHATRSAGTLKRAAHAGRNRIAFRGRIGRRALKPGRYVAIAQATDSAGQRSAKRRVRFTLLAPPRP